MTVPTPAPYHRHIYPQLLLHLTIQYRDDPLFCSLSCHFQFPPFLSPDFSPQISVYDLRTLISDEWPLFRYFSVPFHSPGLHLSNKLESRITISSSSRQISCRSPTFRITAMCFSCMLRYFWFKTALTTGWFVLIADISTAMLSVSFCVNESASSVCPFFINVWIVESWFL